MKLYFIFINSTFWYFQGPLKWFDKYMKITQVDLVTEFDRSLNLQIGTDQT